MNLAVLASMGPIVAFFSFSTTSWPFMVLLNVLVYTVSGLLGMAFLLQTLHRLSVVQYRPLPPRRTGPTPANPQTPGGQTPDPQPVLLTEDPARWTRWRVTCWAGT